MGERKLRWRPTFSLAAILLAGILALSSIVASTETQASQKTNRPTGWLRGRVTDAITGLGLVVTIVAVGPQLWAGSTGPHGYFAARLVEGQYAVTAIAGGLDVRTTHVSVSSARNATVNFSLQLGSSGAQELERTKVKPAPTTSPKPTQPPAPNPTPTTPPDPTPTPASGRRPQLLTTKVGFGSPNIDSSNASTYAERYDILFGAIPAGLLDTLRALNPGIFLLQYNLPGGEQNKGKYPDSYYVKDVVSGRKVMNKDGYYLLNFADPAVRTARRDSIINPAADGYWLDTAGPSWVNTSFFKWRDENGKVADLGELDGSWEPGMDESDKDRITDGTWPGHMLAFIQELKAARPGKLIMFNGMAGNATRQAIWGRHQQKYLDLTTAAAHEFFFVTREGPVTESTWKWQIDRIKTLVESKNYVHIFTARLYEVDIRRFGFGSYLLVADGKYAWFNAYVGHYDAGLYDADYGTPLGAYQTINTPAGPIYKRQFTRATVWVNPGDVTRSGDGKTMGPKTAIFEVKPN